MSVTPVSGVEQLPQAVVTYCTVGRNRGSRTVGRGAGDDAKADTTRLLLHGHDLDISNVRQRWGLESQPQEKLVELTGQALGVDDDTHLGIAYRTGKAELASEPIDMGPESDALDDAGHQDMSTGHATGAEHVRDNFPGGRR